MDHRIGQAVVFMKQNYELPLSITTLAQQSGLSGPRFSHLFRKETGTSPGRMIKAIRMQKAKEMLEGTRQSIKQIMTEVGISDKNHFRRDFKSEFGLTPSEFRKRLAAVGEESDKPAAAMAYR